MACLHEATDRRDRSRDRSPRSLARPVARLLTRCDRRGDRSPDRSPRRSHRVNIHAIVAAISRRDHRVVYLLIVGSAPRKPLIYGPAILPVLPRLGIAAYVF